MPTNVSYCSDESYSSSVKSASHGNVLKQLLLAGKFSFNSSFLLTVITIMATIQFQFFNQEFCN